MFWTRNKKNSFQLRSLIWGPVNHYNSFSGVCFNHRFIFQDILPCKFEIIHILMANCKFRELNFKNFMIFVMLKFHP